MKYNYTVEVTVYDQVTQKNTYKNVEEAMNAAKKSVLDYANTLRVHDYISRIREGINKGYRALVADYWAEFFSSPTFNVMTREAPFEEDPKYYEEKIEEVEADWDDEDYEYVEPPKDPLNDFYCGHQEFDITEFYFDRRFHMETNWLRESYHASSPERFFDNFEMEAFEYDSQLVFEMSTIDQRIVVTVSRAQKTTHSENIVLVYRTLKDSPRSREVIRNYIWENYKADLSLKTIGSHLDTLRNLGVPVAYKGINKYTLKQKKRILSGSCRRLRGEPSRGCFSWHLHQLPSCAVCFAAGGNSHAAGRHYPLDCGKLRSADRPSSRIPTD